MILGAKILFVGSSLNKHSCKLQLNLNLSFNPNYFPLISGLRVTLVLLGWYIVILIKKINSVKPTPNVCTWYLCCKLIIATQVTLKATMTFCFQENCLKRTTIKINKRQKKLLQCHERPAKCTEALSKHSCNIPSLPHHSEEYKRVFNKATEHEGLYIFDVPQLEGKTAVY